MSKRSKHSESLVFSILSISLLAFSLIPAQLIAEEQNIIGVYFDEAGTVNILSTEGPADVQMWVVVKHMSSDADLASVGFWLGVNDQCIQDVQSLIGGQNFGDQGMFLLAASPQIPACDTILICTFGRSVMSAEERLDFYIRPVPDHPDPTPAYVTGDYILHTLMPSSGSFDVPVATINPDGTLVQEDKTWGQIKSIFR